jgi:hypothetical protein
MFASVAGETHKLSKDELILHHHAAMVKKNLELYHASAPENQNTLTITLKMHLVYFNSYSSAQAKLMYLEIRNELFHSPQKSRQHTSSPPAVIEPLLKA